VHQASGPMLLKLLLFVSVALASNAEPQPIRTPAALGRCPSEHGMKGSSAHQESGPVACQRGSALLQAAVGRQRLLPQRDATAAHADESPPHRREKFEALAESTSPSAQNAMAVLEVMHARISLVLEWVFPQFFAPTLLASVRLMVYSTAIWCTLVLVAAWRYKSRKRWPDPEQAGLLNSDSDFKEWTSGPFECFQDIGICFWACMCPCIRWADNLEMVGVFRFWVGLSLFGNLLLLNSLASGLLLWFTGALCWMAFRQQLRRRFDMESDSADTLFNDWALYCFCCPCAIAQEARHIEAASMVGHKAVVRRTSLP